jgi:hypothetical protein
MAFRFSRRIRLMPGVHLNLSKKGVSLSAGMRGASITTGPRGVYSNMSLPGTGLSFRSKLGGEPLAPQQRKMRQPLVDDRTSGTMLEHREPATFKAVLRVQEEDGQVIIEGEDGQPLAQRQLKLLREQHGEMISQWLQGAVAELNSDYEACVNLHLQTPAPANPRWLALPSFDEEQPNAPALRNVGLLDRLLLRRHRIEVENAMRSEEQELSSWNQRAAEHLQFIDEWRSLSEGVVRGDRTAMEAVLGRILSTLPWPRETNVNFDFREDGAALDLDVDLPEIEDMPTRIATVAGRGIRVNFQKRSEAKTRQDYLRLVYGTAFRVAGEVFANLPRVLEATVSEFTQRTDPQTGNIRDDYVLSVRIHRPEWEAINFEQLEAIEPGEALARFQIIRSPDRSGRLRRIDPLQ